MRLPLALICLPLSAFALAGCGSTTTTAGFTGVKHEVAQTIANQQSDATSAEPKKICADELASTLVTRLGGTSNCEKAIKDQLAEIDNLETSIKSVDVAAGGRTASAQVSSIREGKTAISTMSLVKEAGKWKISGID
jgi:hypothetical protein